MSSPRIHILVDLIRVEEVIPRAGCPRSLLRVVEGFLLLEMLQELPGVELLVAVAEPGARVLADVRPNVRAKLLIS